MKVFDLPPRYKMINLLYIVLIALLALNVSSDTLVAYDDLNNSYGSRIDALKQQQEVLLVMLADVDPDNRTRYAVVERAAGLHIDLIDSLRNRLFFLSNDKPATDLKDKKDMHVAAELMLPNGMAMGSVLESSIATMANALVQVEPDQVAHGTIRHFLNTEIPADKQGKYSRWDSAYFARVPAIAALLQLNRFEESALSVANLCLQNCYTRAKELVRTEPSENSQTLTADRAADQESMERLLQGMEQLSALQQQLLGAKAAAPATPAADDDMSYHAKLKPNAFVTTQKRVLYRGYSNKLQFSYMNEPDWDVTAKGASISREKGTYVILPQENAAECEIMAYNKQTNGVISERFTVRSLPEMRCFVANGAYNPSMIYYGRVPIAKEKLATANFLAATHGPDFDDMVYTIGSYSIAAVTASGESLSTMKVKGCTISEEVKRMIASLKSGDKLYFTGIEGVNKDGDQVMFPAVEAVIL